MEVAGALVKGGFLFSRLPVSLEGVVPIFAERYTIRRLLYDKTQCIRDPDAAGGCA